MEASQMMTDAGDFTFARAAQYIVNVLFSQYQFWYWALHTLGPKW